MKHRKNLENVMFKRQPNSKKTASSYHQQATLLDDQVTNTTESAALAEMSVRVVLKKAKVALEQLDAKSLLAEWLHCSPNEQLKNCTNDAKYRTLDGSCNNLAAPWQGASMEPFRRILPSVYHDGVSAPRGVSINGSDLSSTM